MSAATPRQLPTVMDILATLAEHGAAQRLDELLSDARTLGATPRQIQELEQATLLGTSVLDRFALAQERETTLVSLVDTCRDLAEAMAEGVQATLRTATQRARRLLRADLAYLGLHEQADGPLTVVASEGDATAFNIGLRITGPAGLGRAALDKGAPFSTPDYLADRSIEHAEEIDRVVRAEGVRAVVAVPFQGPGGVSGALYGAHREVRRFTAQEISSLSTLASLAATTLGTARLMESLGAQKAELERDGAQAWSIVGAHRRMEAAYDHLLTLVHDGSPLEAITEVAATALGGALAVRELGGELLAAHGRLPEYEDEILTQRSLDAMAAGEPVPLDDGAWVAPVTGGGDPLGTVLFLPDTPFFGQRGPRPLRVVVRAISLSLQRDRNRALAEGRTRDDLFEALLAPDSMGLAWWQLEEQATRLGIAPDTPYVVIVARPEGGSLRRATAWAASYAHRKSGLKSVRDECLSLLLPGDDAAAAARAAHKELSPLLDVPVTVGAAGPRTGLPEVARLHDDAQRCLTALTELGNQGGVATPEELGFLGVLLADVLSVPSYVESVLGPVLAHDEQRYTEFARTLEVYFASRSSPRRAARVLHIHPNTVARRLDRITELLGDDWQSPERALEIQLALRLHRTRGTLLGRLPRTARGQADSGSS
ncbi:MULTISPECIES: helix-turn-helix domain-containing protein [unclassified Streptomyces]|uniref:helix-turn-helix domain-containing protein n=1 Tax=unclassified Streptomyces TaxID=2593676 RepID=UPI0014879D14|nr:MULTISPECIES: helix-turn-helix domain-containing protein [unclassified Streptomyces]